MGKKTTTKGEALVRFVLSRFEYSKNELAPLREKWREYYDDYRGTRRPNKEPWQANFIIPTLKDIVRTKVPLYANILFANGIKSFDIEPGSEEDEEIIPYLKDLLIYQLDNVGRRRGGFFGVMEAFLKQFEIFGYSVAKVPWRVEKSGKTVIFEGPDIEVIDIFSFFPDPQALDISSSWVIVRKRDVFVSYLKQMEKQGVYHSISFLKDTSQPREDEDPDYSKLIEDRVELLEYHGEVPRDLLEGNAFDEATVNPYDDEYVNAIVTIANRKVCIRAVPYPYDSGLIFVDAAKDRMPNETFGCGTAEDIQAMAEELTNAHNKLTDCINLISNPMFVVNPAKVSGFSSAVITACPGKVFYANPNVDNVSNALQFIDTRAQAIALTPLITLINILEEKIQKISHAVPVISPVVNKKGLPETLGATLMMQSNAAEPIKHTVKHCLEPFFQRILEIFYKHNLQFLSKTSAYKVLGKKNAAAYIQKKAKAEITSSDIRLSGNPDFRPRGVTVFSERQIEIENLMNMWKLAQSALVPQTDPMGRPVLGPDGQPMMVPLVDQKEIVKRIAEKMNIDNLDELIPSLREQPEASTNPIPSNKMPIQPPNPQNISLPSVLGLLRGGQ